MLGRCEWSRAVRKCGLAGVQLPSRCRVAAGRLPGRCRVLTVSLPGKCWVGIVAHGAGATVIMGVSVCLVRACQFGSAGPAEQS